MDPVSDLSYPELVLTVARLVRRLNQLTLDAPEESDLCLELAEAHADAILIWEWL